MHVVPAELRGSNQRPALRLIGPFGTVVRTLAGIALVAIPIAGHGLAAPDALGALVVLPALAVALDRGLGLAVSRTSRATSLLQSPAARTWVVHLSAVVLILLAGTALTFVTPIDAGAIWLFFGLSFLVLAARGDGGCEALAIPNAIFGRREETGCVAFAALDSVEARAVASDSASHTRGELGGSDARCLRHAMSRGDVKVELLYIDECPNYRALAPRIGRLLARAGMGSQIERRRVASAEEARRLRFLGSPTVRVNGRDVEAAAEQRRDYGLKCRLYRQGPEVVGVPDDASILAALDRESHR